jgi:glycosyltransferase involved in cell wall biosynthesis
MRVLMITSEWPSPQHINSGLFVVRQVEFLRRAGVDVDVFHFRGAKKLSNYVRAWRAARAKLEKNSYDLVHAQWGQSALLALPKKLPLIVTFRGSDLEGIVGKNGQYLLSSYILRAISRCMAYFADQVIIVSERVARRLPKRTYHVIPAGIDLDLFVPMAQRQARVQLGLPRDKRLVLFPASPKNLLKRYELARSAVERVAGEFDCELVVASDVPHKEMPLYMSACDVLLLTSMHEGSPNVVKEALACNVPVVSVDVGDVRERIGSVNGCVVCEEDSPEALGEGLRRVFKQTNRINGRAAVRDLDESLLAQRVVSVYEQAVGACESQSPRSDVAAVGRR